MRILWEAPDSELQEVQIDTQCVRCQQQLCSKCNVKSYCQYYSTMSYVITLLLMIFKNIDCHKLTDIFDICLFFLLLTGILEYFLHLNPTIRGMRNTTYNPSIRFQSCVVRNTQTWCEPPVRGRATGAAPPTTEAGQSQDQASPPLLAPVSGPRRVWPAGPAPSQLLQTQRNVLLSRSWTGRGASTAGSAPLARQSPLISAHGDTAPTLHSRAAQPPAPPVTTGGARLSLH